jgi:hypothetical protein
MSVLNQFVESSIAVTEQIALMMQENERLKKRVAELENQEPEPEPEQKHRMCDLMPIGETFCGLEVADHDDMDGMSVNVKSGDRTEWLWDSTAKAIYEAEMELRDLRRMNPVIDVVEVFLRGLTGREAVEKVFKKYLSKSEQP